jgi:hypothetical protein
MRTVLLALLGLGAGLLGALDSLAELTAAADVDLAAGTAVLTGPLWVGLGFAATSWLRSHARQPVASRFSPATAAAGARMAPRRHTVRSRIRDRAPPRP